MLRDSPCCFPRGARDNPRGCRRTPEEEEGGTFLAFRERERGGLLGVRWRFSTPLRGEVLTLSLCLLALVSLWPLACCRWNLGGVASSGLAEHEGRGAQLLEAWKARHRGQRSSSL